MNSLGTPVRCSENCKAESAPNANRRAEHAFRAVLPTAEDHGGERDETASGGHAVGIERELGKREDTRRRGPTTAPAISVATTRILLRIDARGPHRMRGFSPQARRRKPNGVRSRPYVDGERECDRDGDDERRLARDLPRPRTSGDTPAAPQMAATPKPAHRRSATTLRPVPATI